MVPENVSTRRMCDCPDYGLLQHLEFQEMNKHYPVKSSKRTIRAKVLAIAGALSVVSIALPMSAKAQAPDPYDFYFAYTAGSFATLCSLYLENLISTEILQEFQESYMAGEVKQKFKAMKDATDDVLEMDSFKSCPLRRY